VAGQGMRPRTQTGAGAFADALRRWRRCRHFSQLELAGRAGVSARHLSFLETGRARPSRQMVLRLAGALDVPLRERNSLLLLAGFAPVFAERPLDDPDLGAARENLEFLLGAHEPFPAFVIDRRFDVVLANRSHQRMLRWALGGREPAEPVNVLRLVLDPGLLRPAICDWEVVASFLLRRLDRQLAVPESDGALGRLRQELLELPGVERVATSPPALDDGLLLIPFSYRVGGVRLSWLTTLATFGAAVDLTLSETTLELLYPADEPTREIARELAQRETAGSPPDR